MLNLSLSWIDDQMLKLKLSILGEWMYSIKLINQLFRTERLQMIIQTRG